MTAIPMKLFKTEQGDLMSGRYSQASRLFRILGLLEANPQGLTVNEIYQRIRNDHAIDKRSVYRDIEALESSGFPVFQDIDSDDKRIIRWKVNRTLKVSKSLVLSPRELVALYLAKNALAPLKDTPFYQDLEQAFHKIETMLGAKSLDYLREISSGIHFEPGPRWGLGVDSDVIDTVRACCDEGQLFSVEYRSQNSGDCRRRTLGPHFLYFARGSIYLVAEDMDAKMVKVFSIPRMKDPQMLDDKYVGEPVDPNKFFESSFSVFQGGKAESVKLIFSPEIAEYVRERRWHQSQQVVPQKDGSLHLSLHVSVSLELTNWILGFGAQVKVVEPLELSESLVLSAEKILRLYGRSIAA